MIMKQKITFLLFLLLFIGGQMHSQVHYRIEGTAGAEFEGRKVSLIMLEEDNREADSTIVVNSKFAFDGELMQPCWAAIRIDGIDGIFAVLEDGNIRIVADGKEPRRGGTPTNDVFQKCWQEFLTLNQNGMDSLKKIEAMNIGKEEKKELYMKSRSEAMRLTKEFVVSTIRQNLDNIIPAFWIRISQEMIPADELNTLLAEASPVLKNNRFIAKMASVREGSPFADVEVEQPDGAAVSLSRYLGKGSYTLVNVWASWCGACIAELPEIRSIAKEYASRNLKIVSISTDRNRKDWEKALKRLDMPWTNVLADYTFVNAYSINRIPALMLISPEGIILKKNFSKEELKEVLKVCR